MNHASLRHAAGATVLLTGCSTMHIPPPADMGAPLPPGAVHAEGMDVAVGAQTYLYYPVSAHLRASRGLELADGPLALELGGNVGVGWIGVNPALHWAPPPRVGGHWRFGGRLGLLGGAGDILGEVPFADPFLGGSLHGQASHFWDDGGAVTAALGWGYTGHTRCMEGCGYSMPREGFEDCTETAEEECPGPQRHSYNPFNAPSLHLRADLPAGHEGYAMMIALGAQPLIMNGRLEPIFTISAGLHHKDPGPQW